MLDLLRISTFSAITFLFIFQFAFISKKIIQTIRKIKELEELIYISYMIREDILKARDITISENKLQILGFMMSLSDGENDSQWGIILSCQDGKAHIFNLNPPNQIFILSSGKIETKNVLAKIKIKQNEFLAYFPDCNFLEIGNLVFSDFYKISWYSENGKIYRESERYYDGKIAKSKFFAGKADLKIEEGVVKISKGDNEISFPLMQ